MEWFGYIRLHCKTPLARTDKIVDSLEKLSGSLSTLGAEVRLLLVIDDKPVTGVED